MVKTNTNRTNSLLLLPPSYLTMTLVGWIGVQSTMCVVYMCMWGNHALCSRDGSFCCFPTFQLHAPGMINSPVSNFVISCLIVRLETVGGIVASEICMFDSVTSTYFRFVSAQETWSSWESIPVERRKYGSVWVNNSIFHVPICC